MSVQDNEFAGQDEDQRRTIKPEPNEDHKKVAAEMMEAYEERPTVVLPGSGGSVSGTAINKWLDEDGNPIWNDELGPDIGLEKGLDDPEMREQIEKDKARNVELADAATEENNGEKR